MFDYCAQNLEMWPTLNNSQISKVTDSFVGLGGGCLRLQHFGLNPDIIQKNYSCTGFAVTYRYYSVFLQENKI